MNPYDFYFIYINSSTYNNLENKLHLDVMWIFIKKTYRFGLKWQSGNVDFFSKWVKNKKFRRLVF